MSEKIYTIPISDTFEECVADPGLGCPFCRLYNKLEENEVDTLLGAALMEPDIRIETNKKGFCDVHFARLLGGKNRLGLGLITESHLDTLKKDLNEGAIPSLLGQSGKKMSKRLGELSESCYVCDRIDYNFTRMLTNAVLFYGEDEKFRENVGKVSYICLPHLRMLLSRAKDEMKKGYGDFAKKVSAPTLSYLDGLKDDVSLFCKKFDYRYDSEPWGNSKDSVERAGKFLCGDLHTQVKKPKTGENR